MRRSFVWLFVALFGIVQPALAAEPTFAQRFAGVKEWDFYYVYTSNSPHSWEEGGVQHRRTVWIQSSSGRIRLRTLHADRETIQIEGRGPATSSYNKEKTESIFSTLETRYDRGTGTAEGYVQVNLYLHDGTYDLYIAPGNIPVTYGGTFRNAHESRSYGPNESELEVNVPVPAPAERKLELPRTGRLISGTWSWEERHAKAPQFYNGPYNLDEVYRHTPASGTVRWFLVPGDPLDVELLVEPQGYDEWMPQAGRDESTPGNAIAIKATLVAKGGGELPVRARTMTFALMEVSSEKGVALNHPLEGAQSTPDLKFEPGRNDSGATISGDGAMLVTAEGSLEEATATVSAFDWGAYGSVLVTAQLEDGRVVVGKLKGGEDRDIRLPKRAADSKIADAWKKLTEFGGGDNDDEDTQRGNDHKGDGLTAYEEYRGLIANGRHTRQLGKLHPMKKDLVVRNALGAQAKSGFKLFEQASGIAIVEATPDEIPESRRVNVHSGHAFRGEQHALWLKGESLGGNVAGENRPAKELGKTPKKSQEVIVDLAFIAEQFAGQAANAKAAGVAMPYTLQEDIDNTVAHELAHGVGAPHHGKETEWFGKREITERMTDYHAYDVDGNELSRPRQIQGRIGRPGNDASGDANCIMCYTNYYTWAVVGPESGPYNFHFVGPQPVGKAFCTSPTATGFNTPHKLASGNDAPGFFGDAKGQGEGAPAGNCLGAMHVRDW